MDTPRLFTAILSAAAHDLRLVGCVGGRVGQMVKRLKALSGLHKIFLVYWNPKQTPSKMDYVELLGDNSANSNDYSGKAG